MVTSLLDLPRLLGLLELLEDVHHGDVNSLQTLGVHTVRFARALGQRNLYGMFLGAVFHDVGKLLIPRAVLDEPGPLSPAQWALMQQHPRLGHELLRGFALPEVAMQMVLYHHEGWDGGGYPYGLRGEAIPLAARLFAVLDTWDALLCERPYKAALSREEAREALRRMAGGKLEPRLVERFLALEQEGFFNL